MSFGAPYISIPEFQYLKPKTLKEALEILSKYEDEAKVLAGGVGLLNLMKERLVEPEYVVDIKGIPELRKVTYEEGKGFTIGATVTLSELENNEVVERKYAALHEAIKVLSDPVLRNRSTLVGNVCEAFAWMDSLSPLLVFDAELKALSVNGERMIKAKDFIIGLAETALEPNELVASIFLPEPPKNSASKFIKFRSRSEFSVINVASLLANRDNPPERIVRLAYGGATPSPVRVFAVENVFKQQKPLNELLKEALDVVFEEVSPMEDMHASKEYREHLMEILTIKIIRELWGE